MAVLQDIERRIEELSPSMFQQLGDAYLLSKNRNQYSAFLRKGSLLGKDKTIKGTPDTLAFMSDNKYLLIEYSTNSTDRANKLIDDIDKCIKKYEAKIFQIDEIILFANYKLDEEELVEIKNYAMSMMVKCDVYGGGMLAMDILTNHPHLISTFLDIPIDTGQIVSLETFVKEYQRKTAGMATPLDNPFMFRDEEMATIAEFLDENDIVILKGHPGVGKTKLALESIANYLKRHPTYNSFAISYKNADLLVDLKQNIHSDVDCIILVDDANTVEHFKQIKGFFETYREGNTKLLITVRDYALEFVRDWLYPHHPKEVLVEAFSADKIESIVTATYGISYQVYLDTICKLSNGNPRLAMMLAKLVIERKSIQSLSTVEQIFDLYFADIYNNKRLTEDVLKVAGLIAFFQYINYADAVSLERQIQPFGIVSSVFCDAISILNELEIVDIPLDGYVKIGEQTLSTYIIYRVFVKDKMLSMNTLFSLMSERNVRLYREKVTSIDNAFDRDTVLGIARPALLCYIKNHVEENLLFVYKNFWVYLIDESLQFVYNHISSAGASEMSEYDFNYDDNYFALETNKDAYLDLLSRVWRYSDKRFEMSISLALDYVRKRNQLAPQLAYHIKTMFNVTLLDYHVEYDLQERLLLYIEKNIESDGLGKAILWPLAQLLTQFSFRYDDPIEKHSFRLCTFKPTDEIWKDVIRKKIWILIDTHYSEKFLAFLNKYTMAPIEVAPDVAAYDVPYIVAIITKHFSPDDIDHCICVQEYINWAKRIDIQNEDCSSIANWFCSDEYKFYLKLRWDYIHDRGDFDIEEYDNFKKNELRDNFVFKDERSAKLFLKRFKCLCSHNIPNKETLFNSLLVIVDVNLAENAQIGFYLLRNVLSGNMAMPRLYYINSHLFEKVKATRIWSYIKRYSFDNKIEWILQYLYNVPEEYVNKKHFSYLTECIGQEEDNIYIFWSGLLRHRYMAGDLLDSFLQCIYDLNANGKHIEFRGNDLIHIIPKVTDYSLLSKLYIQQCEIDGYNLFDYKKDLLRLLVGHNPSLLLTYVSSSLSFWDSYSHGTITNLHFVWNTKNYQEQMTKIFDYLLSASPYLYDKYFDYSHAFFSNLKNSLHIAAAREFLFFYYKSHDNNYKIVDFVVYIAKRYFHDLYKSILIAVAVSKDKNYFFQIDWFGNRGHYTTSGNITHHDVIAKQWAIVLETIETIDNIKVLPLIAEISEIIDESKKKADVERAKRRLYD